MLGSLNKVWPWKVATQTFIDAQGIIRPLIEKNVFPSTYLIENKAEPYLIGAIGFALLGAVIIILFERFFSKPVTKEVDLRTKLGL
jgi:putative membrane protein